MTLVFLSASSSQADICVDPAAGLRACDFVDPFVTTFCEASRPDSASALEPAGADYMSFAEGIAYLDALDEEFDPDDVMILADVPDVPEMVEDPSGDYTQMLSFPVVKITEDVADGPYEDRPDIVFVCDLHPSEWTTSESCMALIDYLVKNATNASTDVPDFLDRVEVWVVPFSNPAGRFYSEVTDVAPYYNTGDPWGPRLFWRKNRYWVEDCETTWSGNEHTGKCDDVWGASGFGNGTNSGRSFSQAWHQSMDIGNNEANRGEMLPGYMAANGDAVVVPPELIDCLGDPSHCPSDHQFCVPYDENPSGLPIYGCFMHQAFPSLSQCTKYLADSHPTDDNGIAHLACQRIPALGSPFPSVLFAYVVTECGTSGAAFSNEIAKPSVVMAGSGVDALSFCGGSVWVMCNDDSSCDALQATGFFDEGDSAGKYDDMLQTGADLLCSPSGYCAYDDRRTCCGGNYAGSAPFEAPETRILRHLVLNSQVTTLVDVHEFGAVFSDTWKVPVSGFGDPSGTPSPDTLNLHLIREEAAAVADGAADAEWRYRSNSSPGDPVPAFFHTIRMSDLGTSAGQLPSWAARTPTSPTGVTPNHDDNTYRGINAFDIELPPWHFDEIDPGDAATQVDWGEHASCSAFSPAPSDGYNPRSRMAIQTVSAGFVAAARYFIAQAPTPLIGYDGAGIPMAERADTGVVGLLVHDGSGKGVIHGETGNTVFVPAGRWAVSGDVLYQNTTPLSFTTPTSYAVLLKKLQLIGSGAGPYQARSLESMNVYGPHWSGDLLRYDARFEFKPGGSYQVSAELTAAAHDDTLVNDVRVTKVVGLGCASGVLPDSTTHDGAMTSDEFCADRIEGDDDRFFCNEDRDRCQECGVNPTDWGEEVAPPCTDWYGAGAFCMDGMCDTPYVCWSAAYEDDDEGAPPREIQGTFNTTVHWVATLHLKSGAWDTDQTVYRYTVPSESIGGRDLALVVWPICTADGLPVDGVLEYRAYVGAPAVLPYADWSDRVLIDWTAASVSMPLPPITLTDVQAEKVYNGQPITLETRSIAGSTGGGYPSVAYSVTMGLLGGGTLPELSVEWEKLHVPPWEPVTLAPSGTFSPMGSIVPDNGRVAAGDTLVFKANGMSATAVRSARVLIVDATGTPVGQALKSDTAITIPLAALDPADGPFEVVVQSTSDPLSATIYHCPANAPDCLQFDPARDACGGGSCANGAVCCRGSNDYAECIDLTSDPDNCGACGWLCGSNETCLAGVCAIVTSLDCEGTTCPSGLSCCEDATGMPSCLERKSDSGNCGWCGHACAANKRCEFGLCVPRWGEKCGASCSGGKTCCYTALGGNQCVNTATAQLNCGKCGNACGLSETCSGGKCEPWLLVYDPCLGGRTNCGAPDYLDCRNLANDEQNCGQCSVRCSEQALCVGGHCVDDEIVSSEPYVD